MGGGGGVIGGRGGIGGGGRVGGDGHGDSHEGGEGDKTEHVE